MLCSRWHAFLLTLFVKSDYSSSLNLFVYIFQTSFNDGIFRIINSLCVFILLFLIYLHFFLVCFCSSRMTVTRAAFASTANVSTSHSSPVSHECLVVIKISGLQAVAGGWFSPCLLQISVTDESDTLFQRLTVLLKGHDKAVLDSYEFFATLAATELGLTLTKVWVRRDAFIRGLYNQWAVCVCVCAMTTGCCSFCSCFVAGLNRRGTSRDSRCWSRCTSLRNTGFSMKWGQTTDPSRCLCGSRTELLL